MKAPKNKINKGEQVKKVSNKKGKGKVVKNAVKSKLKETKTAISRKMMMVIAVVITILAIAMPGINDKEVNVITPELARARSYNRVNDGENIVEGTNENVKFDAFFLRDLDLDGYADTVRGTCKKIDESDTLFMELSVNNNGHLDNGVITITGKNITLQTSLPKDNEIKDNVIGSNIKSIELNTISTGTQKMLTGMVRSAIGNNIHNYNGINSITLSGTYVTNEGESKQVSKTVEFNVDWYGTTVAQMKDLYQTRDIKTAINEEEGTFTVNFAVRIQETRDELLLKKAYIKGKIGELNGYPAQSMEITGTNVVANCDLDKKTFVAQREAVVDEDGNITAQAYYSTNIRTRYNEFNFKIVYPIQAYEELGRDIVEYRQNVTGYYEGYNVEDVQGFSNPAKSNEVTGTYDITLSEPRTTSEYASDIEVYVGKYITTNKYIVSKQNAYDMYNGLTEDKDTKYTVRWYVCAGTGGQSNGLMLKETTNDAKEQEVDKFIKTSNIEESMENVATNIGIYFSDPENMLGENGWIRVYNEESGDLVETFTKDNWNNYNANSPYTYEIPVKHIRIETSSTNKETNLNIYNIKELDNSKITEIYSETEFGEIQYIKSTVVAYLGEKYIGTDTHKALYEAPYSVASLEISKNTISTQTTEKNMKIYINAEGTEWENQALWQNGSFLLELPRNILDIELNEVTVDKDEVKITTYETYEKNGKRFIKINTENSTPTTYKITIDCNIAPDPMNSTENISIQGYVYNEGVMFYDKDITDTYDVNDNLNKEEKVGNISIGLKLISPGSLLTAEKVTEYDNKHSEAVAPNIAEVSKIQKEATINIEIKNNYSSDISETKIVGRVPYEGNKYVINNNEMGSNFKVSMKETGIQVPSELISLAKVYYSENGDATSDLENETNGWKENIKECSEVKSYLVDLGDYKLSKDALYIFTYKVELPENIDYNKVTYSNHAVYFSLHTEQGKYRTQIEANKTGIMVAKQYDLEVVKYQRGKENVVVSGATYGITDEMTQETRTEVISKEGILKLQGLYVDRKYKIKELKSPEDYELNKEEIEYIAHEDGGILRAEEVTEGKAKNIEAKQPEAEEGYKVRVEVEDEAKTKIKINKTENGNSTPIQYAKFKLTGPNYEEGRTLTTDINGDTSLSGLKVGGEYTLEETKAPEGYYIIKNKIKFKVENIEGKYSLNMIETAEDITSSEVKEENNLPVVKFNIRDDKIPTYNLEINKVVKKQGTPLPKVKFLLYKGSEIIGIYETSVDGKITIKGLYEYIEERKLEQTYRLREIIAPEGYAKVQDITFKVENVEGLLTMEVMSGKISSQEYVEDGKTVKITIEDSPSFKLVKKDGEESKVLPGTKFAIYSVNDDGTDQKALNSKGEILGTREIIDGEEYYTLTTNEQGEITADLREGLYKAVEVEASDEKYDITGQVYYFGIGESIDPKMNWKVDKVMEGNPDYSQNVGSVIGTSDGGYVAVSCSTTPFGGDGEIIKYGINGEVEWEQQIEYDCYDYYSYLNLNSVSETSDGGVIVGGSFSGTITVGEQSYTSEDTEDTSAGSEDGIIIKCGAEGKVEWVKQVGGSEWDYINSVAGTSDGGVIAGGSFSGTIEVEGQSYTSEKEQYGFYESGIIIKYGTEGEVKWVKQVGGSDDVYINSVTGTNDGVVAGGKFKGTIKVGEKSYTSVGSEDGIIIKYGTEGEVKWVKQVGGSDDDYINSITETNDGGVVAGGTFKGTMQIEETDYTSAGSEDGIIIEYNSSTGEVEWVKQIGESDSDHIGAVSRTSDGGIVAGEWSYVDEYEYGSYNGTIIKYGAKGEEKWVKQAKGININSVSEMSDGGYVVGGWFYGAIEIEGQSYGESEYGGNSGVILKIENEKGIPEQSEVMAKNYRKEFNITTEVKEFNEEKGGKISGEGKKSYEKVKYGDNSKSPIVMTPQDGYEVRSISVNGIDYPFEAEPDGSYTIQSFNNVTENKHVVVTYVLKNNKIVINKVDDKSTRIEQAGIKFRLDQIEERKVESSDVIKDIEDNGTDYITSTDTTNDITSEAKKELVANGKEYNGKTYNFVQNEEGALVPTNSKTYQKANGGNGGKDSTVANSYMQIDLSGKSGKYVVVVNARVSSEGADYGYATITSDTTAPAYNSSTGQFMKISSTKTDADYTSMALDGGKTYYLHLGYYKDYSASTNEDQVVINSINVYGASTAQYNFISNGSGGYESNNQGKDNTVANSYIPIDLQEYTGKYNLIVNAQVSSQSSDYGYATVTSDTTAPAHNSSTGSFIHISGNTGTNVAAHDYTTVLQGGQMYYLHLGYYKNASDAAGDDKFTINSIKLTPNDSELYHTEIETNSEGQAITQIPFGKYSVTEVEAPEGYELLEEPQIIEFRDGEDKQHEFNITNKKLGKVIVHHYLKDSEENGLPVQVAEDDILQGKQGEAYITSAHLELEKYDLQKDESGEYMSPDGASGNYTYDDIEVKYYYEARKIPLTVHHYIDGTEQPVPLKEGTAEDVVTYGDEGEAYTTQAKTEEELNPKYELVENPNNAKGTYEYPEVEVTYFYKAKEVEITTKVKTHIEKDELGEMVPVRGGSISGEGRTPYETVIYGENSTVEIKATPNTGYKVKEIKVNGNIESFTEGENRVVQLDGFTAMTESKEVEVEFERIPTKVTVHHYIYDKVTGEETTNKVLLSDGSEAPDDEILGVVGDIYASRAKEGLKAGYELYSTPDDASGIMTEAPIEIAYYYQVKEAKVISSITKNAATQEITSKDQEVDYTINYTATIDKYVGDAEITILDTLPYEIDNTEGKSDLAGGHYDSGNRTITWIIEESGIDTINGEAKTINISIPIRVVYSKLNTADATFTNEVTGSISLKETGQTKETEIARAETRTNFKISKEVVKEWNHGNSIYKKPARVRLQIKNGDTVVDSYEVGEQENWRHTFTDLNKYDAQGNEINYTAGEEEVEGEELDYYTQSINGLTVTNTYNGPEISQKKEMQTEHGLEYVVEGEKITYKITVENAGGMEKEVTLQDTVPEGTKFVGESVRVNGGETYEVHGEQKNAKEITENDLIDGIKVNVPARQSVEVSFEVIVSEPSANQGTKDIVNTATVDGKTTNTESIPVIGIEKRVELRKATGEEINNNVVHATDIIKYTIRVNNQGNTSVNNISIKDTVPEGTTMLQINDQGNMDSSSKEINWTIGEITGGASAEVSFEVTVNYSKEDAQITNIAKVGESYTNEITTQYEKAGEELQSSIDKMGPKKITSTEEKVSYTVNYQSTIKEYIGKVKVTITDKLPYEIDEEASELEEGWKYNSSEKTLTWEAEEDVNTYANGDKVITINKEISLKYKYPDENTLSGTFTNEVTGKVELIQNGEVEKQQERKDTVETRVEIPTKVIVHHYVYNEETDEYTTTSLVKDETIKGIVGENYSTSKSNEIRADYECIDETPQKKQGKMTKEPIEVTYYYKLKPLTLDSHIEKTANVVHKPEENIANDVLTEENGEISYTITYSVNVENYVGILKVKIVDKLPAGINMGASELGDGKYNSSDNTITWEKDVNVNGTYSETIVKTIKVVYENQDVTRSLVNEAEGTVKTYYPEIEPVHAGEERESTEKAGTSEVRQEYKVDREVRKIWEDKDNAKGRRPNSVTVQLTANGDTRYNENELEKVELNEENSWTHTFTGLDKYDANGAEIQYSVVETETKEKDLEYYEEPVIEGKEHITVTNKYKLTNALLDTQIEKTGPDMLETKSNEEMEYNVRYKGVITNYIGEAKVTLVDYLPYEIDEEKSEIANGTYNREAKTITWEEEIAHINTYTDGEYKVELDKALKIVYSNLDASVENMQNRAKGTLDLYETEQTETKEVSKETGINIRGKVVVKYVDDESKKEIETRVEKLGKVGKEYTTEQKEIYGYAFKRTEGHITGRIAEGVTEVTYYYDRIPSGGVHVKYVDERTEEEIVTIETDEEGNETKVTYAENYTGYVGDRYKTEQKEIPNYNFMRVEGDPEGEMIEDELEVTYYYKEISGKVYARYIDEETEEEIEYVDEETGEKKTYEEEQQGYVGDEYTTEQKEIPYYNFVEEKIPENKEGEYAQEDIEVKYYYRKQIFNMEIDKTIERIVVNGEERAVRDEKLAKIEVVQKQIENTDIEITYKIKVTNTGEIKGKAKVVDMVPEYFELAESNVEGAWRIKEEGNLETEVELEQNESKEIEVVLKWIKGANNFGTLANVAEIVETQNEAKYEENNTEDNKSIATILMSIKTGDELIKILLITLNGITITLAVAVKMKYAYVRTAKKIKFKKYNKR